MGPEGAGKLYLAKLLASQKIGASDLYTHPFFKIVEPVKNTIGIDQFGELHKFLQLKTTGKSKFRRAIIIQDAHLMTTEAQNSLLKSLEEPPIDTVIILTAQPSSNIRETIVSRVQKIEALPLDEKSTKDYFTVQGIPENDIVKAYRISGGYIGALSALLQKEQDHPLLLQIELAKELIGSTIFSRLIRVDEISKQIASLPLFLQACRLICEAALQSAVTKKNEKQISHWHTSLSHIYESEQALGHNPNKKLLLTQLLLNL
jgi:hypothetical protein